VLKLADGRWLVSDAADGPTTDWHESDFPVSAIRWRLLKMPAVTEADRVEKPDLARVDEIGFTDLMTGGASAACSRLDWMAVYGRGVRRVVRSGNANRVPLAGAAAAGRRPGL
jgi:hypothetical protein